MYVHTSQSTDLYSYGALSAAVSWSAVQKAPGGAKTELDSPGTGDPDGGGTVGNHHGLRALLVTHRCE